MLYYIGNVPYDSNCLRHYGTKGMRWGVRHWQYSDGRFNAAGKLRYFGQVAGQKIRNGTQRVGRAVSDSVVGVKARRFKQDVGGLLSGDDNVRAETKNRLRDESIERGRELSEKGETYAKILLKTAAVQVLTPSLRVTGIGTNAVTDASRIARNGAVFVYSIYNTRKLIDLYNYRKSEKQKGLN